MAVHLAVACDVYGSVFLWCLFFPRSVLDELLNLIESVSRTSRQCYILNFMHLSKVVLKKKIFEYFSMYFFFVRTQDPLAGGCLGHWDLHLNNLGKGLLGK